MQQFAVGFTDTKPLAADRSEIGDHRKRAGKTVLAKGLPLATRHGSLTDWTDTREYEESDVGNMGNRRRLVPQLWMCFHHLREYRFWPLSRTVSSGKLSVL